MGIYDKYVLVTDMDGTLVNSQGIISEENKAAIAEFTAEGGHFAVATGRTPANSEKYIKDLAISTSCIFYNGAMLYDWQKQTVLAAETLKGKIWRDFLVNCLHKFPTACIEIYTPEKCYVVSDPANDDPDLEKEHYIYEHAAVEQIKDEVWLKFFVCDEPEVLQQVELEAEAFGVSDKSTSFYSDARYFEFVAKNVSKGDMLQRLRKLPENKGRLVVAAGDFPNDNRMLELADMGVASANAHLTTLHAADKIGVSCDGHLLAYIIKQLIPKFKG